MTEQPDTRKSVNDIRFPDKSLEDNLRYEADRTEGPAQQRRLRKLADRAADLERAYLLMSTELEDTKGTCPEDLWGDVPWDCDTECGNGDDQLVRCFQRYFLCKAEEGESDE